jgi:hypothetical protein
MGGIDGTGEGVGKSAADATESSAESSAERLAENVTEAEARIAAALRDRAVMLSLADLGLRDVPAGLADLRRLEVLSLRGNRLTALPSWIAALDSLRSLDLADNQLVELPAGLGGLAGLTELGVAGNRHMILPPPDVVAEGTPAVLAFLRAMDGGPWVRPPVSASSATSGASVAAFLDEDGSAGRRVSAGAVRGGVVAVAVALVGTAAALIGAGDAGGKAGAVGLSGSPDGPGSSAASAVSATASSSSASSGAPSPSNAATASASSAPGATTRPSTTSRPTSPASASTRTPAKVTTSTTQYPVAPANVDLALGRPVTVTSHTQNYVGANIVDGSASSYWESTNGSSVFPQTVTVDLGTVTTVGRIELDLPPVADWNQRTQTITVLGAGADGKFTTVVGARGYSFDARTGDATGVSFGSVHLRYVRLVFSGNSGWPAAQLAELRVFS